MAAKKGKMKKPKALATPAGVKKKSKQGKKGTGGPKKGKASSKEKKGGRKSKKKEPKKPLSKREQELLKKKALKEEKERLEQEALENESRAKIRAEEDAKRSGQLRESGVVINQYEKATIAHLQKLKKLLEWEFFIACRDIPNASDLIAVNSYMTEWIQDLEESRLEVLFKHIPGILEVVEQLKAFLEIPDEDVKMESVYELGLIYQEFKEKLQDYLDQGTHSFLEDLTEHYDAELGVFETILKNPEETISHAVWGNLFGSPGYNDHEYTGSGFSFHIPDTISRNQSVIRLLKTTYDHLSDKCYSFYGPGIDNALKQSIANWEKKKNEYFGKLSGLESPEEKPKKKRRPKSPKKGKKKRKRGSKKGKKSKDRKGGSKKKAKSKERNRSKKKGKKSGGEATTSGDEETDDDTNDENELYGTDKELKQSTRSKSRERNKTKRKGNAKLPEMDLESPDNLDNPDDKPKKTRTGKSPKKRKKKGKKGKKRGRKKRKGKKRKQKKRGKKRREGKKSRNGSKNKKDGKKVKKVNGKKIGGETTTSGDESFEDDESEWYEDDELTDDQNETLKNKIGRKVKKAKPKTAKSKGKQKSKGKGKKGKKAAKSKKGKSKKGKSKKGKKRSKKNKSRDRSAAAKAKELERLEKEPFILATQPDELNLRNFHVIDMLHVPPQPINRGEWSMHLMEDERIMKVVPFYEDYSDPPLPNVEEEWKNSPEGMEMAAREEEYQKLVQLDVKLPEVVLNEHEDTIQANVEKLRKFEEGLMEVYEEQKEEILNKLITISLTLPEDVIWFEAPTPVRWEAEQRIWSTAGFYNIKYDPETAVLKFRTSCFGILGFGANRWTNIPYSYWEMKQLEPNKTKLILKAKHVTIELTIQNDEVCLSSLQDVSRSQKVQDALLNVFMRPGVFIKTLRSRGLDLFPEYDSYAYLDGLLTKRTDIEDHVYQCMSMISPAFNTCWSQWNGKIDRDQLAFQMQHKNGNGEMFIVLNTIRQSAFVQCSETSKKFAEEPMPGFEFSADLLQLVMLNGGHEVKERLRDVSPPHVETILLLLSAIRPLSFSQ